MARRIDALHSTRDGAPALFEKKKADMKVSAGIAKKAIDARIAELIEALKQRQVALHAEVDEMLDKKSRKLQDQLSRMDERKAEEDHKMKEDEKVLQRLEESQRTGTPLTDMDQVGSDGDGKDFQEWISLRINTLKASINAMRGDNPEWIRLRDDEVVSFKPKKIKELLEMVKNFGAVDGTSTYASESYAQGPLIEGPLKVGFKTWLLIRACDLHGKQRKDGGDKLIVKWSQDATGPRHFEDELVDNEDGTYKLHVVPCGEGNYTLSLEFENPTGDGSEPIRGSPFKIIVTAPFDYTVLGEDTLGQAGLPWIDDNAGLLRRPIGLQFDPKGEYVFVADQCNDRVQIFHVETKTSVSTFGKKGSGPKDFNTPGYIVADRDDRVIVSDMLNHRLQVLQFNRKNNQLRQLVTVGFHGEKDGQFSFPRGVALTQTGLLLVCDSGNNRIQAFDANNDFKFAYAFGVRGTEKGEFLQPYDVAVNSLDQIFVTDSCHRVQMLDTKGSFIKQWGTKGKTKAGKFRHPTAITVDSEDHIFVCDQGNHRVQVFDPTGEFKHKWGGYIKQKELTDEERAETPDADDGEWIGLLTPIGITVSAAGKVLVSDYDKHVVFDF